ncbi:hypothetical protein BGY98DRAFT_627091 [Russula aff. rugulosa BPL654]|nr:hypothetical protein BGY98DRAFT_627091 [Russula aff. rugulosa BPL654]
MTISIVTRFGGLLDIQKTRFNIDLYTVVWCSQVVAHWPFRPIWHISFEWMTSTFSLTAARQTGVRNPLLLKMGEIISSFGNNTVIISKRLLPPSILFFFPMEIFHIPDYTLTRTQEAVGIRDKEDVSSAEEQAVPSDDGAHMRDPLHSTQYNQMEEDSPPDLTCQN